MSTKKKAQFFIFLSVVVVLSVLTVMNSSFTWTYHLAFINKLLYQTKNTTVINPYFQQATSTHAYIQSHSYINKTNTSVTIIPVMKTVSNVTEKLNSVTKNIDNSITKKLNNIANKSVTKKLHITRELNNSVKKNPNDTKKLNNSVSTLNYKVISLYNSPSWLVHIFPLDRTQVFKSCSIKTCKLLFESKYSYTSDTVIFDAVSSVKAPKHRKKDQVWIIAGWESPYFSGRRMWSNPEWRNQINWTMTYLEDSDIFAPYGLVEKVEVKTNKNYSAIMNQKSKLIAWVVGNCNPPSKRMKYVEQLQKVMKVDIFGRCGKQKRQDKIDIFKTISKMYKFYLGFENSLCTDYITEKFFDRQNLDVIVIVRGSGNYTNLYPKNSFIDTRDFKNAQELGKYLQYLDKNNTAYIEYLKAKEQVRSVGLGESIQAGLCQVCKMLHAKNLHRHVYEDYHKWWSAEGKCNSKPTDIIP